MRSKFFKGIGLYLCGACVMPLYYFWQNFPLFRVRDVGVVIGSCWLVCWLVSKVVRGCVRGEEAATFLLFAMYGTFWCGWPVALFVVQRCSISIAWLNQHRWGLLIVALLLLAAFLWLFLRKAKKCLPNINQACAVFCWLSVGWMLFRTGVDAVVVHGKQKEVRAAHPKSHLPNIYHILLDAHPNQKAMELLGGDLRPFYRELESLGFMTFPDSMSNYCCTVLSVSSMFDMGYLEPSEANFLTEDHFAKRLQNRNLFQHLKKVYSFQVMYPSPMSHMGSKNRNQKKDLTFFYHVDRLMSKTILQLFHFTYLEHKKIEFLRYETEQILSELQKYKSQFGPCGNFFYTHLLCPHYPFLYVRKSKWLHFCSVRHKVDPNAYMLQPEIHPTFIENVYGIDQAILPVLKTILAQYQNEPIQPIILLHSDHGFANIGFHYKSKSPFLTTDTVYGNLLAIYMPDSWKKDAQNLTFINLYRFILNHLLGTNIPYIKDNKQIVFEE